MAHHCLTSNSVAQLLLITMFLMSCTKVLDGARHLSETTLPEMPEVPKLPLPSLPKPELPTLPKTELPPLPEIPSLRKPELPTLPKTELLPLPDIPSLPKPELQTLPKPELPTLSHLPDPPKTNSANNPCSSQGHPPPSPLNRQSLNFIYDSLSSVSVKFNLDEDIPVSCNPILPLCPGD